MPPQQQDSLRRQAMGTSPPDTDTFDDEPAGAAAGAAPRRSTTTTNSTSSSRVQFSPASTTMLEQDMAADHRPRGIRPSVVRRESFIVQFAKTQGPPQITLIMMLIAIGLGCTIGVVPAVMADRFARLRHGYDNTEYGSCSTYAIAEKPEACFEGSADAQQAAAVANLISNGFTFVTSSMIGSLSDEYGRKGILILGLLMGLMSPFMLFLMQLLPDMSPWWYYGCHAATGLVNWVAIALSALADVLPQRFRAPGIGLLLAGFMLGFSLSPILAFFLSNIQLSFMSFLMVVLGLILTIWMVPETLPPAVAIETKARRELEALRQEAMDEEEDQDYYNNTNTENYATTTTTTTSSRCTTAARRFWHSSRTFRRTAIRVLLRPIREMSILNRDSFFRLISLLAFFSGMVSSGDSVLLVYYLEERLSFTTQDVSVMFLIIGIMGLLAQGVLLKPLNDCIGERLVIAFCFLVGAMDNIMYGLARNKTTIYAAVALSALTGMAFPTISAIKANNVAVTEQGRIQGALYSLQALASGVGPVALRFVYRQFKSSAVGPGAMFVFAGMLYLVAVGVALALPSERANARVVVVPEDGGDDYDNDDDDDHHQHDFHQLVASSSSSDHSDSADGSYGSII